MTTREKFIILAIVLLCVASAAFLYRPRGGDAVAVISVDGKEYRRISLSDGGEPYIFSIAADNGKPVSFEVSGGRVRFIDVDCPDHVCEKAGWCEKPGDRAVCMPNRTTLVCYETGELGAG